MQLWLLRPNAKYLSDHPYIRENRDITPNPWNPWFDKAFGFVIRAETEKEARLLTLEHCGAETGNAWLDPELSTCEPLTLEGEAGLIVMDFRSA